MKRVYNIGKPKGSITVFLSLILLLTLSLLFTLIEGARVSTAKVFAERSLITAMDSVFAEYYKPLWDEYHLFGYHTDDGRNTGDNISMEEMISEYMSYTMNPNKNRNTYLNKNETDLYGLALDKIMITNQEKLVGKNGDFLIEEAVHYMKYQDLGKGLEQLLKKFSLLETPKKVSVIYEQKLEVEEKLAEIDQGVLQLMELVDGIRTSKLGIIRSKSGNLLTAPYFIKKLSLESVTMATVGINNEKVFLSVKDSYAYPLLSMKSITNNISCLEQIEIQLEHLRTQQKEVAKALQIAITRESEQSNTDNKNSIDKKVTSAGDTIRSLTKQIESLQAQMKGLRVSKNQIISSMNTGLQDLQILVEKLIPLTESAITITDQLQDKADAAKGILNKFESTLQQQKEFLEEEFTRGMEEEIKVMNQYTSGYNGGYDFIQMTNELERNRTILWDINRSLDQGAAELAENQYHNMKITMGKVTESIKKYSTKALALDYSTLVMDNSKQKDPIEEANKILTSGITSLLINPDSLSDKKLNSVNLISDRAAYQGNNIDFGNKVKQAFQKWSVKVGSDGSSDLLTHFQYITKDISELGEDISQIANDLLFQEYLNHHFVLFPTEGENTSARKPSALDYELEYLISGSMTDKENLNSCLSSIVFLRMLLNFTTIIGDKGRCSEAKIAAASIVGITGFPILISLVQTLILLTWSFLEALLDTCVLLKGKEVPILKKKIILEFPELFLVSRNFLQSKAAQITQTKELSLSYQEHLRIILLTKSKESLAIRSMDLIQENINLRYEDKFYMENCIIKLNTEATFALDSKFTGFSYVQEYLDTSTDRFQFSMKAAYRY